MRSYKSIYSKRDQEVIEDTIAKSSSIAELLPFLRIHSAEQIRCLEAGSALGSLLITFAIMECVFLAMLAAGLNEQENDIEIKLLGDCEWEKIHFKKALAILSAREVITEKNCTRLLDFYDEYRIPLSHGLFTKGIFQSDARTVLDTATRLTQKEQKIIPDWRDVEEII